MKPSGFSVLIGDIMELKKCYDEIEKNLGYLKSNTQPKSNKN